MFLKIGPTVWGRGVTEEIAMKELVKANRGRKPKQIITYQVDDPKVHVDSYGYIVTHNGKRAEEISRVGFDKK